MYRFKDTTEHGMAVPTLLAEAVSIDGEYIENKVSGYRTLAVSGRESLEYEVSDEARPIGIDGMEYYGKRQPDRRITVKFLLQAGTAADFISRYRKLKDFCKGDNRKLGFADDPNAHYTGTLVSVDEPEPGQMSVVGSMEFYCADPNLTADALDSEAAAVENGILKAHVDNGGSAPVFPVYRIKHIAENGYLGIVHAGGAFEMGNREETDTVTHAQSEILSSSFADFAPFTGANPQNPQILYNGTLNVQDYKGNHILRAGTAGSGAFWHGGCRRWVLPADSNGEVGAVNFYTWFSIEFMTGKMGQTGLVQIMLADADNRLIAAFGVQKSDTTGNSARAQAWVGGNNPREVHKWYFTPSVYADQNPFSNGTGAEDILKVGGDLRFYFWGKYYPVHVPELANTKVSSVQVFIGQYGNRALDGNQFITVCGVGAFKGRKDNVNKVIDVPNRYASGSEIVIDTETDSVRLDGFPVNDEVVDGSSFSKLPVGGTDIEFYTSPWCKTPPSIQVEYRKRWL